MKAREEAIVLIDAHCNLCRVSSNFAAPRGTSGAMRWLPNDDPEAVALLDKHGLRVQAKDMVIVVVGERAYVESAAAVQVGKRMRAAWPLLAGIGWLVPKPLRDAAYRMVARRRKRDADAQGVTAR